MTESRQRFEISAVSNLKVLIQRRVRVEEQGQTASCGSDKGGM